VFLSRRRWAYRSSNWKRGCFQFGFSKFELGKSPEGKQTRDEKEGEERFIVVNDIPNAGAPVTHI
jgi:hypothetical protein